MNEKLEQAIYEIESKQPKFSTRLSFDNKNRKRNYFCYLLLIICFAFIYPKLMVLGMFLMLNIIYSSVQIFKLAIFIRGIYSESNALGEPRELPIYSILIPIYNEDKVLKKLVKAIDKIDYPKDLLDVKLLIEEDDNRTLNAIAKVNLPDYFEIIHIPYSLPRTKPKACNYGLKFSRGKYVVVYDAEDRPHPDQLKHVVAQFEESADDVICIQARLNFYNKRENFLTKLFALEYACLFDYILPGLKSFKMPIFLGGTSNHFIKSKLEEIGSWDAFNVTEDAELGIRLYCLGYKTDLIDSYTLEEAPIDLKAWLIQRSRWIKGHFLTSLIYVKNKSLLKLRQLLCVYLGLYLPNLMYFILPVYLGIKSFVEEIYVLNNLCYFNLALALILPMVYNLIVIIDKKWKRLHSSVIFNILYCWLLPIAGIRSAWQIFSNPFYWDKTEHGVSKNYEE